MDLHKWPRLYDIDPELKPPELAHSVGLGWLQKMPASGCRNRVLLEDQTAVALIRDRAVWWLISRGYEVILTEEVDEDEGGKRFIGVCLKTDESLVGFTHADPTEALYLACCKVLGVEP